MLTFAVLGGVLLALFAGAFFMKRRFGVLGLALAAGSLLSEYWTGAVQAFLEQQGITTVAPPLSSIVAVSLALLPAILLLFGGPTYYNRAQRIIGSLLFAFMAFMVLLPALATLFVIEPVATQTVDILVQYRSSILAVLIVYATIDTMLAHNARASEKKHH